MGVAALMADIKQIITQGANIERVIDPFLVSTGRAFTKSELRAEGVNVDNIQKYAALPDSAHVFCTFSGDQDLAVSQLSLEADLYNENDALILREFDIEITEVTVSGVVKEISTKLANNGFIDFLVELRHNRLQITARRGQQNLRVGELRIIDSRGAANKESVNDVSNPHRLFNYFFPDRRAISRSGDLMPAPARGDFVTPQSVGVSQGEPRTSASLNRGLVKQSDIIDKASLLTGVNFSKTRKVRIPLVVTQDPLDFTVDYTGNTPSTPRAIWSTSGYFDPNAVINIIGGIEPSPRRGGLMDVPNPVSVIAIRGISIPPKSLPFYTARIVNTEGTPLGLVSPDSRVRGSASSMFDKTDLDYGVPFITESSRWRVVKSAVEVGDHPGIINPSPLSSFLAFPENQPLIDESQFEILGEEAEIATSYTRIDEVTLELDVPIAQKFKWARVRLFGGDESFVVREWINERRIIISELPEELADSIYYKRAATFDDLNDPISPEVFISRGFIANSEEWFYLSVLGTGGPLAWATDNLHLEIDVADPPDYVNGGGRVIMDVKSSTDLTVNNSAVRSISPTARSVEDIGPYTLKGAHESTLGGMSLRHAVGAPYDTDTFNELLTRAHSRFVNGPYMRVVSDSLGGVTFQQFNEPAPTLVFEQGQGVVDLSEAQIVSPLAAIGGYADGIDYFLDDKFKVTSGDTRYRILRALTMRYATGTFSQNVTIHPETYTLTLSSETLATHLINDIGFLDEHIGLSLLALDYQTGLTTLATPLLIQITSVETKRTARFRYLDMSNVSSGMLSGVVELKLAPQHLINDALNRGESPSIILEGLETIGSRVDGPPSIEIRGERPLESYSTLGDWVRTITTETSRSFLIVEHNNVKYAQIPLTDANRVAFEDLDSRLKVHDNMSVTSLGGSYWRSNGLTNPGDFPEFSVIGAPLSSSSHVIDFYYKISCPGASLFPVGGRPYVVYPPFKVESRDVIVVIQDGGDENFVYGLMIPIPDYAIANLTVRQQVREVLEPGSIEILKKRISINKDKAYIDNAYLNNPSALNELNVYSSTQGANTNPRLEVSVSQDFDEGTPRPSGLVKSRSEHISEFGGMTASSRIESRHEYQDRDIANDNAVVVSEMSLKGGPGAPGEIGLTANHRYDQASGEYKTLVTAYGGDESTSVMTDGLYITDPEARCEDVPFQVMTGFDHKHLSGDVAVNTANVKKLSEELDAMKQREFGMLRQLSLLSAAAHESLDMLRTANATIRSLRDVQYELSMSLLAVMDTGVGDFDAASGNETIRGFLRQRSGDDLSKNMPHRLLKALHYAGHAVMTELPYSNLPTQEDLSLYFEDNSHASAPSMTFVDENNNPTLGFEDCVPLKYDRPGYTRVRTTNLSSIDQNEALDPRSDNLKPTTLLNTNAYYPLYVKATHKDREGASRENVSWSSALNEMKALILEGRNHIMVDFGGLVSYASPLYSFRPRKDSTVPDDMANNNAVCMYLMGVGYWSPTSIGHTRGDSYLDRKARLDANGWFFTSTSTRRVGPEQVSITDDMREYCSGDNNVLSELLSTQGNNKLLYEDEYILSQIVEGKDLIIGVTQFPATGGIWLIRRASLLGYPNLFDGFHAPSSETAVYATLDEAKNGSDIFYVIEDEEDSPLPLPIVPGLHVPDPGSLGSNRPIPMPTSYENNSTIIDLQSPSPDALEDFKVVYCRAWCVVRAGSQDELWSRLLAEGFYRNDIRINVRPLPDGTWVGIRTRLGMADFIKNFNSGRYAAPGQVRFSFNETLGGSYVNSSRQIKTSQDPA